MTSPDDNTIETPGYVGPERRATPDELAETRRSLDRLAGALQGFLPREDAITQHRKDTLTRRLTVSAVVVAIIATFLLSGFHTEHCSPGSRIAPAMDEFAGNSLEPGELYEILNRDAPALCEVTQPMSRGYDRDWPSTENLIGFGILAVILASLVLWLSRPVRIPPELHHSNSLPGDDTDPGTVEGGIRA